MRKSIRWMMRCLAIAHYAWGMIVILLAIWCLTAALMVLPHMSSGTIWSNLPTSLSIAAWQSFLPGTLGVWMMIIGNRAWNLHAGLRKTLLIAHGILLGPGLLAIIVGVYAVRAAEISSSRGGGLLSPIAYVPLAIGVPMMVLAAISIVMALVVVPNQQMQDS